MPHVTEAVVKLHHFGDNDERLVAFLNVEEEFSLSSEQVLIALSEKLPAYMIPSFIQVLNGFPRLPNGKINKKELVFKEGTLKANFSEDEIRTPTEEKIYNIWKEELKIENFSVSDNFFFLGGNSLLAIKVFTKIESAFNIELGLRRFFDRPRIKDIAEYVEMKRHISSDTRQEPKDGSIKSKMVDGEI